MTRKNDELGIQKITKQNFIGLIINCLYVSNYMGECNRSNSFVYKIIMLFVFRVYYFN